MGDKADVGAWNRLVGAYDIGANADAIHWPSAFSKMDAACGKDFIEDGDCTAAFHDLTKADTQQS